MIQNSVNSMSQISDSETSDIFDKNKKHPIRSYNCPGNCASENKWSKIGEDEYFVDMSPKKNNFLMNNAKLNLDLPEDDSYHIENNKNIALEKNIFLNSLDKTLSVDSVYKNDVEENTVPNIKIKDYSKSCSFDVKNDSNLLEVPWKGITSISKYLDIPSSTFNVKPNTTNENNYQDEHLKLRPTNLYKKSFWRDSDERLSSSQIIPSFKKNQTNSYSFTKNETLIRLPGVTNSKDDPIVLETRVTILDPIFEVQPCVSSETVKENFQEKIKCSATKVTTFCKLLVEVVIRLVKKGFKNVKKLWSFIIPISKYSKFKNKELNDTLTLLKNENEQVLTQLTDHISFLTQELLQNENKNARTLSHLTNEIKKLQTENNKLSGINNEILEQLKQMNDKTSKIETVLLEQTANVTVAVTPPQNFKWDTAAPPPPPPPPPPSGLLFQTQPSSKPILTTPKRNSCNLLSPARRLVPNNRPAITVEELLNVTLKKVPHSNENKKMHTFPPGARGPVISLDMLRSVKLKSSKRRSMDHKSPRSRGMKNRSQATLSLSPLMRGAETPLSRILKPSDVRRVYKRTRPGTSEMGSSENIEQKNDCRKSKSTL